MPNKTKPKLTHDLIPLPKRKVKHSDGTERDVLPSDPVAERHEIVFMFDASKCNPNGDPDAGNMPRVQPDTLKGLVTDVCLKRKIRNFFSQYDPAGTPHQEGDKPQDGYAIFVRENAVLQETIEEDDIARVAEVIFNAYTDSQKGQWVRPPRNKKGKEGRGKTEYIQRAYRDALCRVFFDVRTFGGVVSTNGPMWGTFYGQIRGPIQVTFAESFDKIHQIDTSVTRCAVASEEEKNQAEAEEGGNRTMGRKHWADYGLYRCHIHFSPAFAAKTRFTYADLDNFLFALKHCLGDYNVDIAAARAGGSNRGGMCVRGIIVFRHTSALGNAPAHKLFDLVKVTGRKQKRKETDGKERLVFVRENDEFSPFPQSIQDYGYESCLPKDGQAMKYNSAEGKVEFGVNKQEEDGEPAFSPDFPISVHRLVWEIPAKESAAVGS